MVNPKRPTSCQGVLSQCCHGLFISRAFLCCQRSWSFLPGPTSQEFALVQRPCKNLSCSFPLLPSTPISLPPPSPSRFEPCLLLQASFIFRTSPTSLPSSFPSNPRNQGTMIFFVLFAVFLALASASPPMTGAPGSIADAAHTINDCDYGTYEVPRRFTLGPPTGIPTPQGLTTRRGQNQAGQNSGWGQRPRGSENGDSVVDFGLVILEDARLGTR